ncbi:hypothetical protein EF910_05705 [Streptomyces sp. WAC07149]|uniref:hypothetical protein n=1 Tax=Streptomyces sp. WAC07149 TaxID=2487425 RepID=UPI000F781B16|nr:hypothetical protein [Streptomyces sp. WAC07149]RST07932.1 hypothetical protein EF910_05705 [Streptomyces sp. WAC07149]
MTSWEEAADILRAELLKAGADGLTVPQLVVLAGNDLPAMDVRAIAVAIGAKEEKFWTGYGLTKGRSKIRYVLKQEETE